MKKMRFKIFLFTTLSLFLLASCSKEKLDSCNDEKEFYIDILTCESGSNGLLLDKIDFVWKTGLKRQREYIYDKTNQLERVDFKENSKTLSSQKLIYDFQKRVVESQSFSLDNGVLKKSSVNSFVYDSKNRVTEVKYFYIDTLKNLVLINIAKYTYDKNDKVETSVHLSKDYQDTINNTINEIARISKYCWDENNLVRVEDFSKNMELLHEWTYKYDKKKNSSIRIPPIYSPFKLQNTQISFSVKDHTGLLDLIATSPITMLCYNTGGFLTKVERENGSETYSYRNP
jgi:hypothetical protein